MRDIADIKADLREHIDNNNDVHERQACIVAYRRLCRIDGDKEAAERKQQWATQQAANNQRALRMRGRPAQ